MDKKKEAIRRVAQMEDIFDKATQKMDDLERLIEEFEEYQSEIKILEEYLASQDWKDDFESDEKGEFPADLKRGVLSEDGIYNLLERNKELMEVIFQYKCEGMKKR